MKVGYVRCSTVEQKEARQMKMMEEKTLRKCLSTKQAAKIQIVIITRQ